jgi:hypothetical protein
MKHPGSALPVWYPSLPIPELDACRREPVVQNLYKD